MTTTTLTKVERDPDFRLMEAERQRLRRRFDHDALERLLAHVSPEHREGILECFRIEGNEVRELWYIGDPELQSILDEVWAPLWMGRTVEEIEADETERPGKRLAIERKRRDPDPHVVLLAVLEAMDRESWDVVARWVEPVSTSIEHGLSELRARWMPAERRRTILNIMPEGEETAHVLYREQEQRLDGTWDDGTVRVNTVRRTGRGWRVLISDLLAQAPR